LVDDLLRAWLTRLERWVRMHPVAGSHALAQIVDEIAVVLTRCGLNVQRHTHPSGDLLVARGGGGGRALGIYGHCDVAPGGSTALRVAEDRIWGRGVGDNLGPLALRLSALEAHRVSPEVLWLIEPGEEVGSPALADWLKSAGDAARADLWLDETGYFEADGTQRLLAVSPERVGQDITQRCVALAEAAGRATRIHARRLHRVVPETGLVVEALFRDAPYLALGPNDARADVHGADESIPLDTAALSVRQFQLLLDCFANERAE
jgi:acetylornithine deacetylase/succinyl-diaminopimelate desuccinylase-like protein